jgi:hypothetical protein
LQQPTQRYRALFELSLMIEDPCVRIKECSAAAIESMLSLPPGFCGTLVADSSHYSIYLRDLIGHLKSVGGFVWTFRIL